MKKILIIPIVLSVLFFLHCGKDTKDSKETAENSKSAQKIKESAVDKKVILIINEREFTNKNLKEFIKSRYPDKSVLEKNPRLTSRLFDTFVENCIILYKVDQVDIQLDPGEVKNYLRDKRLRAERMDDPVLLNSAKIQKYLDFKLYKDIDVTDAEIREYYDRKRKDFSKKEEVLLHQIVVKEKEKALELRRKVVNSPSKFAEIAQQESISREAGDGGRMGFFEKGILPKDMEDVVFSLNVNEISPVVESPYGCHIFKISKKKGKRTLFLDAVKEKIKTQILSDKLRWAYEDFLSQLKKQLKIVKKYNQLFFTYQAIDKGDVNNEDKQTTNPGDNNNG